MKMISCSEFEQVQLLTGTIINAEEFPEAHKPAYILTVDFGEETGVRKSSAQITQRYTRQELVGKQIIGVVNFPAKKIGPFMSECLITGFINENNEVVLAVPDIKVKNGLKLV